jgi:hypothetical protein
MESKFAGITVGIRGSEPQINDSRTVVPVPEALEQGRRFKAPQARAVQVVTGAKSSARGCAEFAASFSPPVCTLSPAS